MVCSLLILPAWLGASPPQEKTKRLTSSAFLEYGIDSFERAYIKPRFRFDLPLCFTDLFLDADYIQRWNSRLQGEIDFWVRLGANSRISPTISLDTAVNHFCRHLTSRDYPRVLDINELTARLWLHLPALEIAVGGGGYLGTSDRHTSLITGDLRWPRIFRTEFSAQGQVKWVDLKEILYEFELGFSLDSSVDLFARYTRAYRYADTAYLGTRFHARGKIGERIDHFRLRGSVINMDDARKVRVHHEFKLNLFQTPRRRLRLNLASDIPLKRGGSFFGTFHPDDVSYQVGLDYEVKLRPDALAYIYGMYDMRMPVDRAEPFSSGLGLGVGLRNQPFFQRLDRPFRYDFYVGQNFQRTFDMGVHLGINTLDGPVRWGGNVQIDFDPETVYGLIELFVELGTEVCMRPFVAFQRLDFPHLKDTTRSRVLIGVDFLTWRGQRH